MKYLIPLSLLVVTSLTLGISNYRRSVSFQDLHHRLLSSLNISSSETLYQNLDKIFHGLELDRHFRALTQQIRYRNQNSLELFIKRIEYHSVAIPFLSPDEINVEWSMDATLVHNKHEYDRHLFFSVNYQVAETEQGLRIIGSDYLPWSDFSIQEWELNEPMRLGVGP
ncbi:hypothetical protein [Pseudobacteriovorax antillogorgiicola]|uniref:Uncharacterized protein n=1 Tax=Pseudobacteriovorax antillogorgiicola TaxID=1513793 RepID=A0A1Y6C057_9BACT|nr:hypothetical protein [Pseudobacteriovorax antillogorgiicola]TCS51237.1 hypothetical protein EDD56_111122 [Pseudobacteriovorax antillogorgiicola]SMF36797.1 hypothetical protein SAMN06296036_11156 [Pseudobacteriovorax antillogorgiicola]